MDRRSKHLSSEERGVIFAEHRRGSSQRSIGGLLGRPASTICRELARGRQNDGSYCPQDGRLVYGVRWERCRRQRKLTLGSAAYRFVHDHDVFDVPIHRFWKNPAGKGAVHRGAQGLLRGIPIPLPLPNTLCNAPQAL